jgi:hypothetical protein
MVMVVGWTDRSEQHVVSSGPSAKTAGARIAGDQVAWSLIGSLEIEIRSEGPQFVAVEYQTGMYGEGDTADEAYRDLIETLYEHQRDLAAHGPNLSQHLRAQLLALSYSLPK